jgi:hypothetical protein
MNHAVLKKFISTYNSNGEYKFYRGLLARAVEKLVALEKGEHLGILPNMELLEVHNQFMMLYRREGEDLHLHMARLFRKAAHKIYRVMLKKDIIELNNKFLNLIQRAS